MVKAKLYDAELLPDIRALVKRAVDLYGDSIAHKQLGPKKIIEEYSFRQINDEMNQLGTCLISMGLGGKHMAILSENSHQWVVSYLAVVNGAGIAVPLDKELTVDDLSKLIIKSDTEVLFCSSAYYHFAKLLMWICSELKVLIVLNPEVDKNYDQAYLLPQLLERGAQELSQGNSSYADVQIDVDAPCEIIFTSGTTGANKGVMLSHKNNMAVVYSSMCLIDAGTVSMSVLPINHSFERNCNILGGLYCGATLCFNDSLKHIMANLQLFKPTFMLVVPLFLESMIKNIWREIDKANLTNHTIYAVRFSNLIRKIGIDKRDLYFKPIHQIFGGNLKQMVCGGAPLNSEIIKKFDDLGINIVQGYGITECAPLVAANGTAFKKIDSVGKIVPGCKVRISNPDKKGIGEVEVFGDNIMIGYYKDEESTVRSFTEDGWFRTGDLGRLDRHGFLYLSGRKKNLIILPNGKNVFPEEIEEELLLNIPYIKETVVFALLNNKNEQSKICAACFLNYDYINENNISDPNSTLENDIKSFNRKLASYKQINEIRIVDEEFEKTTTQKIKRYLVERRFNNAGTAS